MRTYLRALLLVLLCATSVYAQESKTLFGTTCPGDGCSIVGTGGAGTVGFQVTGTFVGTLQFEQTIDGTNYVSWAVLPNGLASTVTSAAAGGFWTGTSVGAKYTRVRFSTYTSGTAVVYNAKSIARAISSGSGSGIPGGSSGQLQYNNGGVFGGLSKWTVDANQMLTSTATGIWLRNLPTDTTSGSFGQVIGVASNGADPKPDHTMVIGWNVDNAVAGAGSNGLSFESYCSLGTGCLTGAGGQSETYFTMDDGKGNPGVRPLGFFQRKADSGVPFIQTIARSDVYSWFNAPQSGTALLTLTPTAMVTNVPFSTALSGAWITQQGVSLIERGAGVGGVSVAPSSGVDLGSAGEFITNVQTNHLRLTTGDLEDSSGNVRITLGGGSAGQHLAMQNSAGSVLLKPLGTTTNIEMELQSKGSSNIILNPGSSGFILANGHVVTDTTTPTVSNTTTDSCGTTAATIVGSDSAGKVTVGATSGTSCTVTFAAAYVFAPACAANNETTANLTRATSTTSTVILKGTFVAGDVLSYICIGGQ